jgi:FKBP-type peptidyl-prolyl cis-trans isomerase 2
MTIATGDAVTVEYTGRLDDGTVFDTTRESVAKEAGLTDQQPDRDYEPLTVEIGASQIIQGFEDALVGQEEGGTPTVVIPPAKGYGEWSDEHVQEYSRAEFTEMVGGEAPEEGAYLETENGGLAEVVHVDDETVRVDFNHSLAGETLEFDIEIVDVS